jgi:hypothetical protein
MNEKYWIQINWTFPREGWSTVSNEIPDLEKAFTALKNKSNLSRVCAPLRIIDDEGNVHGRYHIECDWRLPGCLWRRTQEQAYKLWEDAGKPNSDGKDFWFEAERQLIEKQDEGIREGDFTEEEKRQYFWYSGV